MDRHVIRIDKKEYVNDLPSDMGLGVGGNASTFDYCLDCGQIQGRFPLPETKLERGELK
jgi:hypothetical protein